MATVASFSPRWFLYLGVALVALAIAFFPMRIPLQAQPGDVDYMSIGWLFAPIIGIYGLASIVMGLVHSSILKRTVEWYLVPILAVVSAGLAYAVFMVVVFSSGVIQSVGRGEHFFLLYFVLVLFPSILIYASALKFLRSEEKIDFLANKRLRIAVFFTLAAVPLFYTGVFILLMYLL